MIYDLKMFDVMSAFINAIDVVNPILKHHHRRVAIIAYYLGEACGLNSFQQSNLILACSLHDIGALTVKDSFELKELDVVNPEAHERLGAGIISSFTPFEHMSKIIRHHHVKASDKAINDELAVPYESFILHLADRIEILLKTDELALNQKVYVITTLSELKGSLFDERIFRVFLDLAEKEQFWFDIDYMSMHDLLEKVDFECFSIKNNIETVNDLVATLSKVIDYKSRYTAAHSARVAHVAFRLAKQMNLEDKVCSGIKLAAYMHDFGKIAIPTEILEKPTSLTKEEFNIMKTHPYYTYEILKHVKGIEELAMWAGSHHEKLDNSGYPKKTKAQNIGIEIQIIIYADIFSALSEDRPYRSSMELEKVMETIKNEYKGIVGSTVYEVLLPMAEPLFCEIKEIRETINEEYDHIIHPVN
ncbi:HD-GYP domain-containing protein [Petrocella sp. FN5]|uniref:HD-GYP domain-containing protein n=1 Tax=Petrocella sp. FN5 TaxID=3032002 RepID=UPI0023DCBC8F|nr:HD domain-containing phosphohydrolase [Petrocella sp. FN5]MDF1618804.1 HD domain-containing protein [Petrocella sp. FN5]